MSEAALPASPIGASSPAAVVQHGKGKKQSQFRLIAACSLAA